MTDEDKINDILNDPNFSYDLKNFGSGGLDTLKDDEFNRLLQETDLTDINFNHEDYDKIMESISEPKDKRGSVISKKHIFHSNIDFVNYFEKEYIKNTLESLKNKDKVYLLQNFRKHSKKIKLVVLEVIKKSTIADRIYKYSDTKLVTCITVYDDSIFFGNSIGVIKMLTCLKQDDLNKTYSLKEIEKIEENIKSVTCMSVSDDGLYLIAGYQMGYIAIWDIYTLQAKKLITNIHKTIVLDVKFVSSSKKRWEFISTEVGGNVQLVVVEDGLFRVSVDEVLLIKEKVPYHLVMPFKISQATSKIPSLKVMATEISQIQLVGFSSLENIRIYNLVDKKKVFEFSKPVWLKDSHVPECSFGFGFVPSFSTFESNLNTTNQLDKNIDIRQNSLSLFKNELQILFAISWGKIVFIYILNISNKKPFYSFSIAGHYTNTSPIIRMEFLSDSILYLFDKKKLVKVINTSLITPGEVKIDLSLEVPTPKIDTERNAEIEEGILVDNDIQLQPYLKDPTNNKDKATYNNCIVSIPKSIFVLGKAKFHQLKLLNWEQCLNELCKNKSEWMDALTLGLDIFNGKSNALADIPTDNYIRETKVGNELKTLIHHYVIMHTANEKSSMGPIFADRLSNCINVCIEFCLELGDVDYLLNTLQPLFDNVGYGDLFIEKLEPFILTDKRLTQQLQQMNISKIIDIYTKSKKIEALSQILIHLDIKSMDIYHVKEICLKNNLITPLIFIYTHGIEEDFFSPILIMWKIYSEALPLEKFTNYNDLMEKYFLITDIQNSKTFNGHKLLWYIYNCFLGKKVLGDFISENLQPKTIFSILHWIFYEDNNLEELLKFDSKSFFLLMDLVFKESKIIEYIEKLGSNEDFITDIQQSNKKRKEIFAKNNGLVNVPFPSKNVVFSLASFLDFLIQYSKKLGAFKSLYEFIIKISIHYKPLQKVLIIEAAKYLLETGVDMNLTLNAKSFEVHLEEFSHTLIMMIEERAEFDNNDFLSLLSSARMSSYVMVKVYLQKQLKNYKGCLETLLAPESNINNKEKVIFDWINDSLYELEVAGDSNFDTLKKEVLDNLNLLAKISIEHINKLVEKWFENNQLYVIGKLQGVKDLQLKYVENVIDKFKEEADYNEDAGKKEEQYHSLLKLQINLLCKLKPHEVLPNLIKRGQAYPISECLEYCLRYKVYDGAIYLKQTLGEIKEALEIAIKLYSEIADEIFLNLKSDFKDSIHNKKIAEMEVKLKLCIDILEKNTDKTDYSEDPDMWFILLEKLYKVASTIKVEYEKYTNNQNDFFYKDLESRISEDIKNLLEKMCSYVSIHHIISVYF